MSRTTHDAADDRADGPATAARPGVTRRTVLKWAGVGTAGLAVAAGGTVGIRAAVNGVWDAGRGDPYRLWDAWPDDEGVRGVVAAGVLAANPHNTQPWRFRLAEDAIEVRSDPRRRMPVNDASHREHFAGLGCAVENMVLDARARGLAAQVTAFPEGPDAELAARLVLSPARAERSELYRAIGHRHTQRGPFDGTELRAADLAALDAQATGLDGVGVHWVRDAAGRRRMGELLVEATEAIVSDPEQSREAFSWFRNDRADIDRHRDGLTLDCQGLGGFTLFAAKVLPAQSRAGGDRFWLDQVRRVHTATAAAYGVVTVTDVADRARQVEGGRLLERLHLAATARGLGFQPMNQITERIDRDRALGRPSQFSERYASLLGLPASSALLAFRVGRPEREARRSPRRALAAVVVS